MEAELDTGAAARRARTAIADMFGHSATITVVAPSGIRRGNRYVLTVAQDGQRLAKQAGLLDASGRPVRGLPAVVVNGALCDAEAAWRGAFLAHGSLTEPGRSSSLEVSCPGPEAALALVGAARRLGIASKAREVRGIDRVVIRDGDAISAMLTKMGAHESVMAWEERRMRREVRATANRLANFDDANLRRSARAAVAAGARVERALLILGDTVPDHLAVAGKLRLRAQAGQPRGARCPGRSPDDQGRDRRADPPTPGPGRQARDRARDPQHGGRHLPGVTVAALSGRPRRGVNRLMPARWPFTHKGRFFSEEHQ